MEMYDVVKKLIGAIDPVGETNTDNERYTNLGEMTDLIGRLLFDIRQVANCKTCHQYSMNKAGSRADQFLKEIKEA